MYFKKLLSVVLAAVLLCTSSATTAFAEGSCTYAQSDISLAYEIARTLDSVLSISGTTATCISTADGENTVSITVTQTLQKRGFLWIWGNVDGASWSRTVNGSSIRLSNTKSGLSNGTYRVKSVFKLTDTNGKTETVTIYSTKKEVG